MKFQCILSTRQDIHHLFMIVRNRNTRHSFILNGHFFTTGLGLKDVIILSLVIQVVVVVVAFDDLMNPS